MQTMSKPLKSARKGKRGGPGNILELISTVVVVFFFFFFFFVVVVVFLVFLLLEAGACCEERHWGAFPNRTQIFCGPCRTYCG